MKNVLLIIIGIVIVSTVLYGLICFIKWRAAFKKNRKEANRKAEKLLSFLGSVFKILLSVFGSAVIYMIRHSLFLSVFAFFLILIVLACMQDLIERRFLKKRKIWVTTAIPSQGKPKLGKTNILKSENGLYTDTAYFDNGIVYRYLDQTNKEIIIGKYNSKGVVFDNDGYETGEVDPEYGFVSLNRFGDLQRIRESLYGKSDEHSLTEEERTHYYDYIKRTNVNWICAEINNMGVVKDKKTNELIAEPLSEYDVPAFPSGADHQKMLPSWEDESYKLGFGACFISLVYQNRERTKYSSFYCPVGEKFVEP